MRGFTRFAVSVIALVMLACIGPPGIASPAQPAIAVDAMFGKPSAVYVRGSLALGKPGNLYVSTTQQIVRSGSAVASKSGSVYTIAANGSQWDVVTGGESMASVQVVLTQEAGKWQAFTRITPKNHPPEVIPKTERVSGTLRTQ